MQFIIFQTEQFIHWYYVSHIQYVKYKVSYRKLKKKQKVKFHYQPETIL